MRIRSHFIYTIFANAPKDTRIKTTLFDCDETFYLQTPFLSRKFAALGTHQIPSLGPKLRGNYRLNVIERIFQLRILTQKAFINLNGLFAFLHFSIHEKLTRCAFDLDSSSLELFRNYFAYYLALSKGKRQGIIEA